MQSMTKQKKEIILLQTHGEAKKRSGERKEEKNTTFYNRKIETILESNDYRSLPSTEKVLS